MKKPLLHEELTRSIIAAFFEVYNELTFGFREHIYVNAIDNELVRRGHVVAREVGSTVWCKNEDVGTQRLDMVVDNKIIVEVKSTQVLHQSAMPQLTSYLKGTAFEVGLLLHFGEKPRFHRCILTNDQKKNIRALSVQDPSNPCPESVQAEEP
jgi:GxxExxY protein